MNMIDYSTLHLDINTKLKANTVWIFFFLKKFIKQLRNNCIEFEELPMATGNLKIANAV